MIITKFVSPLEKVFRENEPRDTLIDRVAYSNESLCFQLCLTTTQTGRLYLKTESEINDHIEICELKYVPALMADYVEKDDYRIFTERTSTYYPDLLEPLGSSFIVTEGYWTTLWVTIKPGLSPGNYSIRFITGDYEYCDVLSDDIFDFSVCDIALERCDIPVSCWMYYDCIAAAHRAPLFSEKFYDILDNYFITAEENGINTVFVPLFAQRIPKKNSKDMQLIDIRKIGGRYSFDFSGLNRFIDHAMRCGFSNFEFTHIASTKEGKFCPRITADDGQGKYLLFGEKDSAQSPEYHLFLKEFFPRLFDYLKEKQISENCYFHIFDEPGQRTAEAYEALGSIMRECLPQGKLIDAVNDFCFSEMNILDYPVVGTNNVSPFIESNKNIWVYYCCDQSGQYLSNRFFNFTLLRTRVIGVQLYLNDVKGFLHWAYNDWHDMNTYQVIEPRFVSDGGGVLPAGDTFLVYPGDKQADVSIRLKAFAEGIKDYRTLKTLENKMGRKSVLSILRKYGFDGFCKYTHDENTFVKFWIFVRELLADKAADGLMYAGEN